MHEMFSKSAKCCTFILLKEEFLMNELPSLFKVKGGTTCFQVLVWKSNQVKTCETMSGWSRKISAISDGCHTLFRCMCPIFHLKPLELLLFKYIMNIQHLYTYKYCYILVCTQIYICEYIHNIYIHTYVYNSYIFLLRINSRTSSQKARSDRAKKKKKVMQWLAQTTRGNIITCIKPLSTTRNVNEMWVIYTILQKLVPRYHQIKNLRKQCPGSNTDTHKKEYTIFCRFVFYLLFACMPAHRSLQV